MSKPIVSHWRPNCINMHSDLLVSVVLCGKGTKVRRKTMNCKMTGAAGLAGGFVAGMVVATAWGGGGMAAARAKAPGAAVQEQQVIVQRGAISPTVTDEDIVLLRRDL